MTVADPAGDAPAAGGRDGLARRGFRRLAEQGPGLLEGPVPSQSPCLQPLTPVRAHLRQAMTSSSYAGNPRFGYEMYGFVRVRREALDGRSAFGRGVLHESHLPKRDGLAAGMVDGFG